jgi:hypothetical protein
MISLPFSFLPFLNSLLCSFFPNPVEKAEEKKTKKTEKEEE